MIEGPRNSIQPSGRKNKDENLVLGDRVRRIYRSAIDLQNTVKFHGTRLRLISFTPL